MALTQDLGRFAARVRFVASPREAAGTARLGFTDMIATMRAGALQAARQSLRRSLRPPVGEASLSFSGETALAPEAAWINGTAGHALDYGDVAPRGHHGSVVVRALLAEGEARRPPAIG